MYAINVNCVNINLLEILHTAMQYTMHCKMDWRGVSFSHLANPAAPRYHVRPTAKCGIAVLNVDKTQYQWKQTGG